MLSSDAVSGWTDDLRKRLDELLDEHRSMLRASVDGLAQHCGHADILREQVLAARG